MHTYISLASECKYLLICLNTYFYTYAISSQGFLDHMPAAQGFSHIRAHTGLCEMQVYMCVYYMVSVCACVYVCVCVKVNLVVFRKVGNVQIY